LFETTWGAFSEAIQASTDQAPELVATFIKVFKEDRKITVEGGVLLKLLVNKASQGPSSSESGSSKEAENLLFEILRSFEGSLFEDPEIAQVIFRFLYAKTALVN
jgi:hypothetical protein